MKKDLKQRFTAVLGEERVRENEPMSRHTTFRIGGPADYFLQPGSAEEIRRILEICREEGSPAFVLGNGSNLLVSDGGYRGVILQISRNFGEIQILGETVRAQAGALLSGIARAAEKASLTGLEFAAGIPGTLGGALVMNAGAYGGEMKDVLLEAAVMNREGKVLTLPVSKLAMGYRTSIIKTADYLVLEAVLSLKKGGREEIGSRMRELAARRQQKQPLEYPSAGSTFKRPEGHFAGKLIMDAGLRGYRAGGAQVSEKHCGFVINTGDASAADVRRLMADVQRIVYERSGVRLEPEVKFLGDFD